MTEMSEHIRLKPNITLHLLIYNCSTSHYINYIKKSLYKINGF
jgi:hypothetical protein